MRRAAPGRSRRPLVVVSGVLDPSPSRGIDAAPRRDYDEIAALLGADLLGYPPAGDGLRRRLRSIQAKWALDLREALLACARARRYGVLLSLSEKCGLPLAGLLRLARRSNPHVMIAHKLGSPAKLRLFDLWPLQNSFALILCLCSAERELATARLGLPAARVVQIAHGVDDRFFRPRESAQGDYVLSVGQEQRDYATLSAAMAGTGIRVVVVDSSAWQTEIIPEKESENLERRRSVGWPELRELYAGARLVVVPLRENSYAAGSTGVLEAMAMGKAVVVTRTGLRDYLREEETARCVAPADPAALRDAVLSLYHDAAARARLGAAARDDVVARFGLDRYAEAVAAEVRAVAA